MTTDRVHRGPATVNEVWRDVPGYEGLYQVSDQGGVKSLARMIHQATFGVTGRTYRRRERLLRPGTWQAGHLFVILWQDGCSARFGVHQLVLLAFVGPCPVGQESLHWDGDPTNNRLGNLRYGTRRENWEDAIRHGSRIGGQNGHLNPRSKLNPAQVAEIRASKLSQYQLAKIYGVSPSRIWYVRNHQSYRSVT